MKNLKLLVFVLFATATLSAQELTKTAVPQSFTEGLLKEYPKAENIEWKRNGNDFKVTFDVGNMEREVWFNREGTKVRVEKEITHVELPSALVNLLKTQYADYRVDAVESNEKEGVTTYKVELEKGWNEEIEITFTSTGKVLNIYKD
ncbi:MAG: PepSY-like domain-containing protein [Oceanihabitans sp.]|nr:PepSY-like domain-containing protein [Oceanihabitans sp.]